VLGGAISGGLGWEWVFAVNVPVGLAGAALAARLLPESREPGSRGLDVAGALTLTVGVGAVLFGLSRGEADGLAAFDTVGPLAAGLALLALFAAIERRALAPLLPPGALRAPGLARAVFAALAITGSTTPAMFLCVLHVQREGGLAPAEAGLLFVPMSLAVVAGSLAGPRITARTGDRRAMTGGLVIVAAGAGWLAVNAATSLVLLAPFALIGGGLGVASVASTAAGTTAGADRPGLSSGLLNTAAQLGSALGLALLVAPAAAAGYAWGWAGAAAVAMAAALAIAGVRRRAAAAGARRSPG
jgi:predicted MFS family arabinose efflux permease